MIIYKTINLINGKIYIGQDSKNNSKYLGSGTAFNNAVKKYGRENFKKEILEDNIQTKDELNEKEVYWIEFYNSTNREIGYNLTQGGKSTLGYKHTDEAKRNMSINQKGKHSAKKTSEHKEKIGKSNKGKKRTAEMIENMRISKSGSNNTNYGKHLTEECKEKIRIANTGKKFTDEHRLNLSNAQKGKKFTDEHKDKLKQSSKKRKNKDNTKKEVYLYNKNMNLIFEYPSINEASRNIGISSNTIRRYCNNNELKNGLYYSYIKKEMECVSC